MTTTTTTPTREGRRITWAWLALSLLTVTSWWIGPIRGNVSPTPNVLVTVTVLVLALVKARLVIRQFMEVRTAPAWLRIATDVWLIVLWGTVLVIYLW